MSTVGNQVSSTKSNQTESTLESRPTVPPAAWDSDSAGFPGQSSYAAASSGWQVGDVVLDLYRVEQRFTGGMGLVYRVRHLGWNLDMAVKIPRRELLQTPASLLRFKREAETWVKLGLFPHVVNCYYVRTIDAIPHIFAEFVTGGSLKDRIRRRQLYEGGSSVVLSRLLDTAIQIAWGLDYAHQQDLVHRDVKPANVMMTPEGVAKITDFGLASAVERAPADASQQPHARPGCRGMTVAYCSPEQAAGKQLTHHTDMWSWGLTVLEMFTGEAAWTAGHAAPELLADYLRQESPPGDIPAMPASLAALLSRCFCLQPADRPESMQQAAAELEEIYQQTVGSAYPRQRPQPERLLADSANNQAVSLLDLGQWAEAGSQLDRALESQPAHPEALFNRGLMDWQAAAVTDQDLLDRLTSARCGHPEDWRYAYVTGITHLACGDCRAAAVELELALAGSDFDAHVQQALDRTNDPHHVWGEALGVIGVHDEWVNAVAMSKDGRLVLSGGGSPLAGRDNALRLWRLPADPTLSRSAGDCTVLEGHSQAVTAVAMSADGRWGVSAGADSTLRLWNLMTGVCTAVLEGHTDWVHCLSMTPDGALAVSGGRDGTLRLWDLAHARCRGLLQEGVGRLAALALSADGRFVLGADRAGQLCLWELADSAASPRILGSHESGVTCLSVTGDWRLALSTGSNGSLRLWRLDEGKLLAEYDGHAQQVTAVSISDDGSTGLSGDDAGLLRLWDLETGCCLRTFLGHTQRITAVAAASTGRLAVSASNDRSIRWWRIGAGKAVPFALVVPHRLEESASYRRQLGQAEASMAADQPPAAWRHLQAARQLPGRQHDPAALDLAFRIGRWGARSGLQAAWPVRVVEGRADRPACVAVSPDGSWAVSGGQAPVLRFWRLASDDVDESIRGSVAPYLTAASQPISDLAVSSDGRTLLAAGGWNKSVCQWRLLASKWGHRFEGHTDFVSCVTISPDNNLALSGSYDTDLRFWSLVRNVPLAVLSGHSHWVSDVAFSPDGRRALSASGDHSLRLWDLASAACSLIFEEGHTAPVQCVVFTPDGRHALSGGWDGFICCWQVDSGRCVARLEGHDGRVNSLAVTPGGRFVFSAGSDRMIRAWRLPVGMTQDESEACVMTLQGHTQAVTGLALTPDARHVVSAAEDGLRLWELDWAYEFPGGSHPGGCEDA